MSSFGKDWFVESKTVSCKHSQCMVKTNGCAIDLFINRVT